MPRKIRKVGKTETGKELVEGTPRTLKGVGINPPYLEGQDRKVIGIGKRRYNKDETPYERRSENWDEYGKEKRKRKKDRREE